MKVGILDLAQRPGNGAKVWYWAGRMDRREAASGRGVIELCMKPGVLLAADGSQFCNGFRRKAVTRSLGQHVYGLASANRIESLRVAAKRMLKGVHAKLNRAESTGVIYSVLGLSRMLNFPLPVSAIREGIHII